MVGYAKLIAVGYKASKGTKGQITTILISFCLANSLFAVRQDSIVRLETKNGTLEGSLVVPGGIKRMPVALIIAGSGPTDRDGNQPAMQNNSLKMLADALSQNGIASLRYDKRGVGKSQKAGGNEIDMRFEQFISDAEGWIELLKKDKRFNEVTVIGHSQGSLLGMLASQEGNVDRFVSIAGPGKSIDKTIKEQFQSQSPEISEMALPIIDKLTRGETVDTVSPVLYSLFRPSVQPYIISWMKYDPAKEIARLKIPVLIIQGSTDIQVSEEDANILAEANPESKLIIVKGMNHIFRETEPERMKNIATYNQPELPIKPELVEIITDFIKNE